MGQIKITRGSVSEGSINEHHLVSNHLNNPNANLDKFVAYAEQRHLMTLLVSGARETGAALPGSTPKGTNAVKTTIPVVPRGQMMSPKSWSYKVMGRIQKACEVIGTAAVGTVTLATSTRGCTFKLRLKDSYLTLGMNARFPNGDHARVKSLPTGYADNFVYTFETLPGKQFSWASWLGVMSGTKTIFGGFTSVGERSTRGYGNFHYPDTYIQHSTTQRKSIDISGDANTEEVIWYHLGDAKGFVYEGERQARTTFLLEDEYRYWFGESSMKDQYGNLLARASRQDEKGDDIVEGDGWFQQVRGANDMETSGIDGRPTYDDFSDAILELKKGRDDVNGTQWICVTGSTGRQWAQEAAMQKYNNVNLVQNLNDGNSKVGGTDVVYGYDFTRLNVGGHQILFVEHPMFDDEQKFPLRLSNGTLRQSASYYFMDFSTLNNGLKNIEIRARGKKGIDRNMVYMWQNGMTGEGKADNPIDAKSFHMLKETFFATRRVKTQGIMEPPATA